MVATASDVADTREERSDSNAGFRAVPYPTAVFALAIAAFAALLFCTPTRARSWISSVLLRRARFRARCRSLSRRGAPPVRARVGNGCLASSSGFDQPTVPVPCRRMQCRCWPWLSAAPFNYAAATWTLLNFACLGIAAEVLRRALPQLSPVVIASFVLFAAVPTEAALGQPAGFELLAVAGAGWCVRLRSSAGIGIGLLFAAIQPYVALPLGVATAVVRCRGTTSGRRVRRAVGRRLMVLLERLTIEYVTVVAPEHARANALEITQLSFTSLLAAIGVPLEAARILGVFIYVASLAVGLWPAYGLLQERNDPKHCRGSRRCSRLLARPISISSSSSAHCPARSSYFLSLGTSHRPDRCDRAFRSLDRSGAPDRLQLYDRAVCGADGVEPAAEGPCPPPRRDRSRLVLLRSRRECLVSQSRHKPVRVPKRLIDA